MLYFIPFIALRFYGDVHTAPGVFEHLVLIENSQLIVSYIGLMEESTPNAGRDQDNVTNQILHDRSNDLALTTTTPLLFQHFRCYFTLKISSKIPQSSFSEGFSAKVRWAGLITNTAVGTMSNHQIGTKDAIPGHISSSIGDAVSSKASCLTALMFARISSYPISQSWTLPRNSQLLITKRNTTSAE
jgi:hypothetical protein